MKPNYDDSITGFNEAWNIINNLFNEVLAPESEADAECTYPNCDCAISVLGATGPLSRTQCPKGIGK